jgi:flagellar protein FliO/FliZ
LDSSLAQANATIAPMQLPVVDSGATLLTTLGYLCLLLGVMFLAYYLLKRLGIQGWGAHGGKDGPRLISRLALGARQSVTVVRFRDRDLLLGVTEDRVSLLADVEAGEDEDRASGPKSFAALLGKKTGENAK